MNVRWNPKIKSSSFRDLAVSLKTPFTVITARVFCNMDAVSECLILDVEFTHRIMDQVDGERFKIMFGVADFTIKTGYLCRPLE